MRPSALVAVLALAACASGCNNGRISEQDDIQGVVSTFLDQCARQRVLRVLPELVPAAQATVIHAGSTTRGCARILKVPASVSLAPTDFDHATTRLVAFDGARARVAVRIGSQFQSLVLSRGKDYWRIEGP